MRDEDRKVSGHMKIEGNKQKPKDNFWNHRLHMKIEGNKQKRKDDFWNHRLVNGKNTIKDYDVPECWICMMKSVVNKCTVTSLLAAIFLRYKTLYIKIIAATLDFRTATLDFRTARQSHVCSSGYPQSATCLPAFTPGRSSSMSATSGTNLGNLLVQALHCALQLRCVRRRQAFSAPKPPRRTTYSPLIYGRTGPPTATMLIYGRSRLNTTSTALKPGMNFFQAVHGHRCRLL